MCSPNERAGHVVLLGMGVQSMVHKQHIIRLQDYKKESCGNRVDAAFDNTQIPAVYFP